jgi:hypothetical protein
MMNILSQIMTYLLVLLVATGCAAPQPVPFQLVDTESKIQWGTLFQDGQRIEVKIDGHLFSGFYIFAGGAAISQSLFRRHYLPADTITNYYSNSARAHLTSDNGQQLNCEFLFESQRAIGQCQTPAGITFHLNADGAVPRK